MRDIRLTEEEYQTLKTILVDCTFNFNTSFEEDSLKGVFISREPISSMNWGHLDKSKRFTFSQLSYLVRALEKAKPEPKSEVGSNTQIWYKN